MNSLQKEKIVNSLASFFAQPSWAGPAHCCLKAGPINIFVGKFLPHLGFFLKVGKVKPYVRLAFTRAAPDDMKTA
jgi:hypothetical protein